MAIASTSGVNVRTHQARLGFVKGHGVVQLAIDQPGRRSSMLSAASAARLSVEEISSTILAIAVFTHDTLARLAGKPFIKVFSTPSILAVDVGKANEVSSHFSEG